MTAHPRFAERCPVQQDIDVRPHQREPWQRGGTVPRAVAERAYDAYAARYGRGQSLDRLCERGGFGPWELDLLAPGWREHFQEHAP